MRGLLSSSHLILFLYNYTFRLMKLVRSLHKIVIEIRIGHRFFNDTKKSSASWSIVSVCETSFGVLTVYIRALAVVF